MDCFTETDDIYPEQEGNGRRMKEMKIEKDRGEVLERRHSKERYKPKEEEGDWGGRSEKRMRKAD